MEVWRGMRALRGMVDTEKWRIQRNRGCGDNGGYRGMEDTEEWRTQRKWRIQRNGGWGEMEDTGMEDTDMLKNGVPH